MKIYMRYGGLLMTSTCTFYDPYLLIIDEEEKTIEINDHMSMTEGMIHYKNEEEVEFIRRNEKDELTGDCIQIIENGKLVYKEE